MELVSNIQAIGAGLPPQPLPAPPTPGGLGAGLPAKGTLDYLKTAIELLFLLLAIPWVVRELVRSPSRASRKAANTHLKA